MKEREFIIEKTELAKQKLDLCKDIIDKYQEGKNEVIKNRLSGLKKSSQMLLTIRQKRYCEENAKIFRKVKWTHF